MQSIRARLAVLSVPTLVRSAAVVERAPAAPAPSAVAVPVVAPAAPSRAPLARLDPEHAADAWVDADGDGEMDDWNHDGRVVGGIELYRRNSAHGPFVHIDARWAARW